MFLKKKNTKIVSLSECNLRTALKIKSIYFCLNNDPTAISISIHFFFNTRLLFRCNYHLFDLIFTFYIGFFCYILSLHLHFQDYLCSSSLTSLCMRRFKCFTVRTAVSGTSIVTMLMSDIARWMRQLKLVIQTMSWWWSIWWIISWYSTTQTTIHTVSCWLKEMHWVNGWTKFDECFVSNIFTVSFNVNDKRGKRRLLNVWL